MRAERTLPRLSLHKPAHYEIVIQGHLHPAWARELGGMGIKHVESEYGAATLIHGEVRDQPALAGILVRLVGNGYALISVAHRPVESASPAI